MVVGEIRWMELNSIRDDGGNQELGDVGHKFILIESIIRRNFFLKFKMQSEYKSRTEYHLTEAWKLYK